MHLKYDCGMTSKLKDFADSVFREVEFHTILLLFVWIAVCMFTCYFKENYGTPKCPKQEKEELILEKFATVPTTLTRAIHNPGWFLPGTEYSIFILRSLSSPARI